MSPINRFQCGASPGSVPALLSAPTRCWGSPLPSSPAQHLYPADFPPSFSSSDSLARFRSPSQPSADISPRMSALVLAPHCHPQGGSDQKLSCHQHHHVLPSPLHFACLLISPLEQPFSLLSSLVPMASTLAQSLPLSSPPTMSPSPTLAARASLLNWIVPLSCLEPISCVAFRIKHNFWPGSQCSSWSGPTDFSRDCPLPTHTSCPSHVEWTRISPHNIPSQLRASAQLLPSLPPLPSHSSHPLQQHLGLL